MVGETLLTLVHGQAFDEEYLRYSSIEEFCDPIDGLMWGISCNPLEYDLVWPDRDIRIAKSDQFQRIDGMKIPRIRIFFSIVDEETAVLHDMQYEWDETEP